MKKKDRSREKESTFNHQTKAYVIKETILDNAPCDESTTFFKGKPRLKGKETYEESTVKNYKFYGSYASLPSIAK